MELGSVQELPRETGKPPAMIKLVTGQGMAQSREVDTNLMGASRIQARFQIGESREFLEHDKVRAGGPMTNAIDPHAFTVIGIAADRSLNSSLARSNESRSKGTILPAGGASRDLLLEIPPSVVVERHDHETRRVLIKAMHDPRAVGLTHVGRGREVSHKGIGQGPSAMSGRRVNDQTGRLVDDRQIGILVDDRERHDLGLGGKGSGRNDVAGHQVAACQAH